MSDKFELKAILSAVDKMSPVFQAVVGSAKGVRKAIGDIAGAAGNLSAKVGLPFAALSGLLGGFSLVAIKNAVVSFTDMGESLYISSLKTGIAVEELQRMKYVAEQAGVPVEALEGGIGKLNKKIGEAAAGKNKDLAALFQKLHISMRDSNGQLRSGIDMLPQLGDAFLRNKNAVVQARMGNAAFGKTWQEMIPLLMEGSEGIAASLARFKQLKGVISAEDIKGAKEFGDKLKDLSFVTKGFQMTIAKELVPVLAPVIESLIQWSVANKKIIAGEVKRGVQDLVRVLQSIDWAGMVQKVRGMASSVARFVEMVGGLRNILIAVVLIINAQTLVALGSLAAAIYRVGAALFAIVVANPVLLGIAAAIGLIAGAAYLVYQNWDTVGPALMNTLGPFLEAGAELVDNLKVSFMEWFAMVQQLVAVLGPVVLPVLKAIAAVLGLAIYGAITLIIDNMKTFIRVLTTGVSMLNSVVSGVRGLFGGGEVNINGGGAAAPGPSLIAPAARVGGEVKVSFDNAPQGTRVEQTKSSGDVPLNLDVGYRSFAAGMN